MAVRVQTAAFDPGAELNALHAANLGIGAVAGFVGKVRPPAAEGIPYTKS